MNQLKTVRVNDQDRILHTNVTVDNIRTIPMYSDSM